MKGIFNELLTFIYGIAHPIGTLVAKFLQFIFHVELPLNIIDAVGFLCVLTAFIILFKAAKKNCMDYCHNWLDTDFNHNYYGNF